MSEEGWFAIDGHVFGRPRLLDLFCGAGGAAAGYDRAGFEVVGVDLDAQPEFPFTFVQGDALEMGRRMLGDFDAVHASPPCQGYTSMSNRWRGQGGATDKHPRLIAEVRAMLQEWGGPYVIENVPGARKEMRGTVTLHGGMFGLNVSRPRLFESNVMLLTPTAEQPERIVGVYGKLDGRRLWSRKDGSTLRAARTLLEASEAMGIDWMTWDGIKESIPPAYTEYIGRQLMRHVAASRDEQTASMKEKEKRERLDAKHPRR